MYQGLLAEEELYRRMVDIGVQSGMRTVIARVHAVLFLEPGSVSLEELAEKTGYSLASISNAVKHLETIKHAQRIHKPGSKKVYVQGEKNIVRMIHEQFKQAMDTIIRPVQEIMPPLIIEIKQAQKDPKTRQDKKEELKAKIAWYEDYLDQNRKIGELFTSIERSFKECEQERR